LLAVVAAVLVLAVAVVLVDISLQSALLVEAAQHLQL
jgi:hypothetical protein